MSVKIVAGITLIPFLSWSSIAWSQTQSRVVRGSCIKPIGRIINSENSSYICEREQINVVNETLIICYFNGKIFKLQPGVHKTDSVCSRGQDETIRRCTPITPKRCPNRKGPDENENALNIVQPYGKILVNDRPLISWAAVPGATSYIVQVKNNDVTWQKQVSDTTLAYPKEQKELQYGSASKITVIANKGDFSFSIDTLVVHLLPETEITHINQTVQQINSLGLPADEVFIDLNAIYTSHGLLDEAIEVLEARVAAGNRNPTLYRTLGDRYLEAWLPQEAKLTYTKAVQLARVQGNSKELGIAHERLGLLKSHNQLPTRINAAQ